MLIFKQLIDRCTKNFEGSVWDKAIKDPKNAFFYEWIMLKMNKYFDKNKK